MSAHEWLVRDVIPAAQCHILAGSSGAGKTTLAIQLIRDLLDGKPWFGVHTILKHPLSVVYLCADRSVKDAEYKMQCMGVDAFRLVGLVGASFDNRKFDPLATCTPSGREFWVGGLHERLGSPDLLVVDPLSPFLPARLNDYHAVASALIELNAMCEKRNFTLLGMHHATKLKPDTAFVRPQDRILGSAALQGYSGTQMILTDATEVPKAPGWHLLTINPHNAPPRDYKLRRDESKGTFMLWDDNVHGFVREQKLLQLISAEPERIHHSDLIPQASEALDCSTSTVERLLARMLEAGQINRPERGYYSRRIPS